MSWAELFDRRILVVSGKGGTGKSTVAAALAIAASRTGRRVLLAEVEGRGEIARTLGVDDPGYHEVETRLGPSALSITPNEAARDYLHTYFGLDRVSRALLRTGFLDQLIGFVPGFRDLLTCGKLYEIQHARHERSPRSDLPTYDLVVVDAPPTGQIAAFLAAPAAFAELVRVGRLKEQASGIDRVLRRGAGVVLVAVPEEMSVRETIDSLPNVAGSGVSVDAIVANRVAPPLGPRGVAGALAKLTAPRLVELASETGTELSDHAAARVLADARRASDARSLQTRLLSDLRRAGPAVLELPDVIAPSGAETAVVLALADAVEPGRTSPSRTTPRPSDAEHTRVPAPLASLRDAIDGARIVVVCGSGGVGKTTVSAAIAVRLAATARRPVLLTIDPAHRLATALGLPRIPGERAQIGVGRSRTLEAMQLDTQRTFDELVERYAGSRGRRDRILTNPFYRRISNTLAGTHEYMAMERLHSLATEEDHDAIVIDTPPTRSALSFLDAPNRLTDFLGGRLLRVLLWPSARAGRMTLGVARLGASAFARVAGRLVSAQALVDVAEFLAAFEGMYAGFRERAAKTLELLRSEECRFVVVTGPRRASLEEAGYFVSRLREGEMHPAAIVVNRWHEPDHDEAVDAVLAAAVDGEMPDRRAAAAALRERARVRPRIDAEASAVATFAAHHADVPIVTVADLGGDVHDVAGLRRVGAELFRSGPPPAEGLYGRRTG